MTHDNAPVRLDKWLWAARICKTRSIAAGEIAKGRVAVNGQTAKPARELHIDDRIELRLGGVRREIRVRLLSAVRGPAPVARTLYEETAASIAAVARAAQERRWASEPAATIAAGRPTKRDRRALGQAQVAWHRWSASIDDTD